MKHLPVNWIDGMKINKSHFIAQDDACKAALHDAASLSTSPLRYGILPPSAAGEDTFNVQISADNQHTVRVSVLACQAVTPGGIRISLPALTAGVTSGTDGVPALSFPFPDTKTETGWWVVLTVHPFEKRPAGSPDLSEDPPRYPSVVPSYSVQIIPEDQYSQFSYHPYALMIGKIISNGSTISVDEDYIPASYAINASPDLLTLHAELDSFMSKLETLCSLIIQNIYTRKQQNEISGLVEFLCDRVMLYLGPTITHIRWMMVYESPASLFACVASLARIMKNTIDLRIGSGKEEMLNYLSKWCDLKQGELEEMFGSLAEVRYDNNDINKNVQQIIFFVKTTLRLFDRLSKLEFIGEQKSRGTFVKEEVEKVPQRRFFG